MKKYLEKCLLAVTCLGLFFGCKNNAEESLGKKKHYDNVDALFIINTSDKTKGMNDNWIYVDDSSRSAEAEEYSESDDGYVDEGNPFQFVEHTVPCTADTGSLVFKSEKQRAADEEKTVVTTKYKDGEWMTFNDTFGGQKQCALVYEGQHCYIWTDRKAEEDATLTDEQIKTFAEKFDTTYEKETALCGPKYDGHSAIDGIISPCEKISVVLFDINSDGGSGNVYGYFTPSDFHSGQGNNIEAIYADSYYAKMEDRTSALHSAVAHEFNHMLNYVNKVLKYGLDYPTWFTEMLSLTTEDILMDDLQVPVDGSPWARLSRVFFYRSYNYGFGNWRDIQKQPQITGYNYANCFLFGAYLERNYGGAQLIHEIATNEYSGEDAVVNAVNKLNGTNLTFDDLLREYGYVLVNTENQNEKLPSLAKGSECKLDGYDFTYKVKPIIPSELLEACGLSSDLKLVPDKLEDATDLPLDCWGFQFYQFDEPADIDVRCMNFLDVKVFRK